MRFSVIKDATFFSWTNNVGFIFPPFKYDFCKSTFKVLISTEHFASVLSAMQIKKQLLEKKDILTEMQVYSKIMRSTIFCLFCLKCC